MTWKENSQDTDGLEAAAPPAPVTPMAPEQTPPAPVTPMAPEQTPPTREIKLYVALPQPDHGYKLVDELDTDMMATFMQIETKHRVKIQRGAEGKSITIRGFMREQVRDALIGIQAALELKAPEGNIFQSWILVAPPRTDKESFTIVLKRMDGGIGVRPVSATDARSVCPLTPRAAKTEYTDQLEGILNRVSQTLRAIPDRMRMRAHFGSLLLQQWKKGQPIYTFEDTQKLLRFAGRRGTATMDTLIGTEDIVNGLRVRLSSLNTIIPLASGASSVSEVKPTHSIILVSKNLNIESTIGTFLAARQPGDNGAQPTEHGFGPLQAFHREKRQRTVEIITSSPENHHDWVIEIQTLISPSDAKVTVPFDSLGLQKNVKFAQRILTGGFPVFKIQDNFIETHEIENVLGKVSWTYTVDEKYSLDVSIYHKWGTDTTVPPTSGAGVTFYSHDWDDDMDLADLGYASRPWKDFARQFLQPSHGIPQGSQDAESGCYENFLSWVYRIQAILDETVKEKAI